MSGTPTPTRPALAVAATDPASEARRRRIRARLDRAEADARRALDAHLEPLRQLFDRAAQNAPAFADHVLGLSNLLALAADHLPLGTPGRYQAHLEQAVTTILLDPEALETAARHAATGYLSELAEIEGRVLIDLRADRADGPGGPPVAGPDPDATPAAIAQLVAEAGRHAGSALRAALARELAVLATAPTLARTALRLVTAAGLGGAVLSSGPVTLAFGLAAALVVDEVLQRAWTGYADPRGRLIRAVRDRLATLQHAVLEGRPGSRGLRPQLARETRRRLSALRSALRQTTATPTDHPKENP